jgi:hypothetical protein
MKILTQVFGAYIITAVIVDGNIFYRIREWIKAKTPWLFKGNPPRHLLECRMCTGFWVSVLVALLTCGISMETVFSFFLIYGASYFLATQER